MLVLGKEVPGACFLRKVQESGSPSFVVKVDQEFDDPVLLCLPDEVRLLRTKKGK